MMINAFTVVSEFKFDVANAIIGTDKLQQKVEGLSNSVGNALSSVEALGMGFIANFSGASAGILGLLGNALGMSDKFSQSQLSYVQIIDSNMAHLSGSIGTMNEQMLLSQKIMNDISKDARKFGLPANELLEMSKTLTAMLVPKGLAGENFSASREMSRNLLKSAPNLGINPSEVQGQLLRSIEGSASMGDTLFRRLITEAPESFQQAKIKDAKGFNALDAAKRFNILNESLAKFANNSKILEMRANTLSGTMQMVKDLFMSFNSILKPLGDVIMKPLVEVIQMGIKYLDTYGRDFVKSFAKFIEPMIENPKKLLLNLVSLRDLASNVGTSAGIVSFVVSLSHFKEIMGALSQIPFISGIVSPLTKLYNWFMKLPIIGSILSNLTSIFDIGHVTTLKGAISAIGTTILRMAGMFAVLLIPLTGLSRAIARMKIDSLDWLVKNASSLMDTFSVLKNSIYAIFAPINDMISGWEQLFYTILGGSFILNLLKSAFEGLTSIIKGFSDWFIELYAGFQGILTGLYSMFGQFILNIAQIIENLKSGNFSDALYGTENIFTEGMAQGAEAFMKTLDKYRVPTINPDGSDNSRVSNVVNNYDVKMNNNFKEVIQPDRIAFTIMDQLNKASENRVSASNKSMSAQLSRGY